MEQHLGNAKCNVVGLDCVVACWCPFHSFKPTPNTVFYAKTLYSHFTLSCHLFLSCLLSLSCLPSLSLLCLLSLTHPCSSIYTSWSTENSSVFNPCCREPVQHTVTQSTDYLLIQSHANTVTLNWPLTHALSLHTDTCYQVSYHDTRRWGVVQGLSVATTYSITWCAQPLRRCSASVQIMEKKWWKKCSEAGSLPHFLKITGEGTLVYLLKAWCHVCECVTSHIISNYGL